VRTALTRAVSRTHSEAGCLLYALHESEQSFCMIERWATAHDLEVHGTGVAITELGETLRDRLTGPADVQVFKAVAAGTEQQGRL
jgi:quinol monooxygenase YgiN